MGRGGARYRAGRPGWRRRCEDKLSFDIRRLGRKPSLLQPGSAYSYHWSRDGEKFAEVGVYVGTHSVELQYAWTPYGGEQQTSNCRLVIDRTPCHFGGSRKWFICPDCQRRCAVVYGVSRRGSFACRTCQRLGYRSESESVIDRCWRAQRKLEAKLAEDGNRPKWMRQRTFERINQKWDALEERKDAAWIVGLASMMTRLGMTPETLLG